MQYQSAGIVIVLVAALGAIARFAYLASRARGAERRLREVTALMVGRLSEGVIVADMEGRITSMNPAAERITGWMAVEARNRPLDLVLRLIDAETLAPVASPLQRVRVEGPAATVPTALVRKDDSVRDIEDSVTAIRGDRDRVCGCIVVFRDVTDERRLHRMVDHQLHTSRICATIIESSNDALFSHTLDGTIDSWNPAAEALFGFRGAEIIGQPVGLLVPRELDDETAALSRRVQSGERIEHFVTERVCADGRRVVVSLTLAPIRDNAARIVGSTVIARDVTAQLEADRHEREWREESARLSRELVAAERRTQEIVGELAHELLHPLAPIVTAAHLVQHQPSNAAAVETAAQILVRQVEAMRVLIEELVDATRAAEGRIELAKDRVDVAALIEEAAEAARTTDCQALLIVSRPSQPVYITADPRRLLQIVTSLLSHSCKFTGPDDEIHVSVTRDTDSVAITVRDTGTVPGQTSRVIHMFNRPERSSRTREGIGTGLGVVKSLVHLHGGTIAVDPGLDRGWTVRVRLPA